MTKGELSSGSSNGASPNGVRDLEDILLQIEQSTGPYGDVLRELVAEGFVPDPVHVAEIEADAAIWPE
ncbi:MAG: hypothetical protein ACRDK2_16570 [Solirubrobacteraceae bacterium]